MKFNETSPALTAKQISVTRMLNSNDRIARRQAELREENELKEMIEQQRREGIEKASGLS